MVGIYVYTCARARSLLSLLDDSLHLFEITSCTLYIHTYVYVYSALSRRWGFYTRRGPGRLNLFRGVCMGTKLIAFNPKSGILHPQARFLAADGLASTAASCGTPQVLGLGQAITCKPELMATSISRLGMASVREETRTQATLGLPAQRPSFFLPPAFYLVTKGEVTAVFGAAFIAPKPAAGGSRPDANRNAKGRQPRGKHKHTPKQNQHHRSHTQDRCCVTRAGTPKRSQSSSSSMTGAGAHRHPRPWRRLYVPVHTCHL